MQVGLPSNAENVCWSRVYRPHRIDRHNSSIIISGTSGVGKTSHYRVLYQHTGHRSEEFVHKLGFGGVKVNVLEISKTGSLTRTKCANQAR